MSDLLKFIELDWRNGALFIAGLVIMAVFLIQKFDWIVERFGVLSKRQIREANEKAEMDELKQHAKKTDDCLERITHSIDELKGSINKVAGQVAALQKKSDAAERNRLRDRIGQAYRYYNEKGQWNSMEKEAFNGLIESYESVGGNNGFVHEKCIPASLEWKVIEE